MYSSYVLCLAPPTNFPKKLNLKKYIFLDLQPINSLRFFFCFLHLSNFFQINLITKLKCIYNYTYCSSKILFIEAWQMNGEKMKTVFFLEYLSNKYVIIKLWRQKLYHVKSFNIHCIGHFIQYPSVFNLLSCFYADTSLNITFFFKMHIK